MRPHDTTSCLNKLAPQYPTMPRMCRTIPQTQFSKVHVNMTSTNQSHGRLRFIGATALQETPSARSQIMFAYMSNRSNPTARLRRRTKGSSHRSNTCIFLLLVTVTVETYHQCAQWPLHTTEREMQTIRSPPVVTHATAHIE